MRVYLGLLQHLAIGGIDTHVTSHALDLDVKGMAQARIALFLYPADRQDRPRMNVL